MAEPTKKSAQITNLLEDMFGRTSAIKADHCIPFPIGCGKRVTGFRNAISQKEYLISGLCQDCQDKVFGKDVE